MAFFRKSPAPHDELAELRRAVQTRGQAKIAEANAYVDAYLAEISAAAGNTGPAQQAWIRDRLRLLMVMSWANWFDLLDRIPESPQLRAEWNQLAKNPGSYGPGELVAWWWHLHEALFRPSVANQLDEMRGALTDGALEVLHQAGGDYPAHMVNWSTLFD
jgi:hypothetical protein